MLIGLFAGCLAELGCGEVLTQNKLERQTVLVMGEQSTPLIACSTGCVTFNARRCPSSNQSSECPCSAHFVQFFSMSYDKHARVH